MTQPATLDPNEDRVLLILAIDHRNSLERDLYGFTPPTPAQAAQISADRLVIYQALLDATEQLSAPAHPGILIDEQHGASVAELAAGSGRAVNLSMPIEASGEEWFHFAYGDDWVRHAEYFAADHPKVLVRDNPGFDPAQREGQAQRLAQVSAWAAATGRALILELLVPATDADKAATGNDPRRYDDERRPGHTVAVVEYLQDRGVEPAIWKVEGLDGHDDAVAVVTAAGRGGRAARCIVLGRHRPTTPWSTGCRSPLRYPGLSASLSAGVSGGMPCTPICTTIALRAKPGVASPPPIWTTPGTTLPPVTAPWPTRTPHSGEQVRPVTHSSSLQYSPMSYFRTSSTPVVSTPTREARRS